MKKQSFEDQVKAALPMLCQNVGKMPRKPAVSGQAGAATRGASCLVSTTQRSGYEDVTMDSARARLATFLSGYHPFESPDFPTAHAALFHSDSPFDVLMQNCCAVASPSKTESTAMPDFVASGTIEKTCVCVCLSCGGSLPPPGHSQPGYLQYITGYYSNSCPYGMWVGGPYHMSAGGGWSSPCGYGVCGACGGFVPCCPCASHNPYVPCGSCYPRGPSDLCGPSCYCPFVPHPGLNTQTAMNWSTATAPVAQGTPETEIPEVPDNPENPPMTSSSTRPKPKPTVAGAKDDIPEWIHGIPKRSIPGVACFAPAESVKKQKSSKSTSPKTSIEDPCPSKSSIKPDSNSPKKRT